MLLLTNKKKYKEMIDYISIIRLKKFYLPPLLFLLPLTIPTKPRNCVLMQDEICYVPCKAALPTCSGLIRGNQSFSGVMLMRYLATTVSREDTASCPLKMSCRAARSDFHMISPGASRRR